MRSDVNADRCLFHGTPHMVLTAFKSMRGIDYQCVGFHTLRRCVPFIFNTAVPAAGTAVVNW